MKCLKCNSEEFEEDYIRGEAVCMSCGVICETYNTEDTIEFVENKFGAVQAVGKFQYSGNISKYRTREKAKQMIGELCAKLRISDLHAEKALQFFTKLLEKGKTQRTSRLMTVGICVYLAARLKSEPLVLLDVSDKINVSVYRLGKLYTKLKTVLGLEIKSTEPSLFVERGAEILKIYQQKKEIMQSAFKLLKVMENDTIVSQGNPKMIAIAALVISAKLHKVDVVYNHMETKFGIHQNAINSLINKWKNSPVSDLTLVEFRNLELEHNSNRETVEYKINEINTSIHFDSDSGEDLDLSASDNDDDELERQYLNTKSQSSNLQICKQITQNVKEF